MPNYLTTHTTDIDSVKKCYIMFNDKPIGDYCYLANSDTYHDDYLLM